MVMPSPDWNTVKLRWAGTKLTGEPEQGTLEIKYDGGVRLDDDKDYPISIFPRQITVKITEQAVLINGESRNVGYAEVEVPASNDPDIQGGNGTYTIFENLSAGGGRTFEGVVADLNAPNGEIWVNKMASGPVDPGNPPTTIYYSDFITLKDRVDALESAPGVSSWNDLTDKPALFPPSEHTHSIDNVNGLQAALDSKGTSSLTLGTTSSTAKAGDYQPTWAQVSGKPSTFTPVTGTGVADAKPGNWKPTIEDLPSGSTVTRFYNAGWPARGTTRADISVRWIGGTASTPPTAGISGVDFWEYEAV